ncbi:DUF4190 domain-containing protein [Actinoplanes regularis]|uniref:DUF4190 domain-containing protein n=1 Tax=Actinoplanes regularis TaxID=52697 RepID=A0A239AKR4_9ACTN|nr:DUF4190 domain-containing protein [Actinoplanes regularis]GIE91836.1 hypothetical protein Are01nite_83160 [Actinoplanes regularis]SNR95523.1 protein of unknown function [Actinoplanes regularis]
MHTEGTGLEPADWPERPRSRPPVEWDPDLDRDQRDELSGFAVASLVFGLIGGLLFSLVFGVAALVKIKQTGQRGKGLAVAGLVLTGVWLVVIALVYGVNRYVAHRAQDMVSLQIGQCFDPPAADGDDAFVPGPITTLPCTQPHRAEMAGWLSFAERPGGDVGGYPGAAALVQRAETGCPLLTRNHVLDPLSLPPDVHPRWYVPRDSEWVRGSHDITCLLVADRSPLSRPLRENAAVVNADQLRFLLAIRDCAELTTRIDALRAGGPSADLGKATKEIALSWSNMELELRVGPWPSAAQPAMDQLIADVAAARPLWQEAAAATGDDDLRDRVQRARQLGSPEHILAARRALRLSTTQGEPLPGS